MKTRAAALAALLLCLTLVPWTSPAQAAVAPSLVPTFSSVGLYWAAPGGSSGTRATVSYRPLGSGEWRRGTDLWFDGRAVAGRPKEYRGSLIGLASGTTYEVRLALSGTSTAVTSRVRTWSEAFPIGRRIELPASSSRPVEITQTGSASGYVLVTGPGGGPATIDVRNAHDYSLRISSSSYVIVRGLTLKGGRKHGLVLGKDLDDVVHDVVVEGNSISGWGSRDGSGFGADRHAGIYSQTDGLARIVVQGNRIGSPRTTANSWAQPHNGSRHPTGPQGILFRRGSGHHVIRYNDVVGDAAHHFSDAIGGTGNFGHGGFPGRDSDVIGNYVAYAWDDGIEAEGAGMNVRVTDNYLTEVYHAFGMSAVSVGPLYAVRNVQDVARAHASASYGQAMFKMGGSTADGTWYGDGRTYLFHNTALKPRVGPQNRKAIEAGDGRTLRNLVSRNNILRTGASSGTPSISDDSRSTTNSFDHDLYNGLLRAAAGAEPNGVRAEPVHVSGWGMDSATRTGSFALAAGSPGVDRGVALPGINDGWAGRAPDTGAHETSTGAVTYGANAFRRPSSSSSSSSSSSRTVAIPAEADTMVREAGPTSAYGRVSPLAVDLRESRSSASSVRSHLRFSVRGLAAGERVTAAAVSLRTTAGDGATGNGPQVWRTADTPSRSAAESMTWAAGRPSRSGSVPVGNFGRMPAGTRVATPVSGVTGNGPVSLELAPESADGLGFVSREGASPGDRPLLVLTVTRD